MRSFFPPFSITRHQVIAILLSFVAAGIVTMMIMVKRHEVYLMCRVQPATSTEITLFANRGGRYNQLATVAVQVGEQNSYSRMIRFQLHGRMIKNLRMDFSPGTRNIHIEDIFLTEKDHTPFYHFNLKNLHALQDIDVVRYGEEYIEVVVRGPHPQLQLDVQWWVFFLRNFYPGLWLSLTFLLYPLFALLLWFFLRVAQKNTFTRVNNRIVHPLFLMSSAVFFVLALLYLVLVRSEHQQVAARSHDEAKYQKDSAAEKVTLYRLDGLRIAGKLYRPRGGVPEKAALLLLHGNFAEGQSFTLYPIMAAELAERGYLVLTIDFAGYGASEDPFASPTPRVVNFETETEAALAYLREKSLVPAKKIGIIGHSLGAEPALRVGLRNPLVGTIMLIGPPRRVWERFHTPEDINYFWDRALSEGHERYNRDGFPAWYTQEQWLDDILQRDIMHMLPLIQRWDHKPLLFVDGERETAPDKLFLASYFQKVSYPKGYVTLMGMTHHCNVQWYRHPLYYDPAGMEQAVTVLDGWYEKTADGHPTLLDYGKNLLTWFFYGYRFIGNH